MSAKKRRSKAKINQLIRMGATYTRLYVEISPHRDAPRSWRFWFGCIVPLGDALEKQKPGAWASLSRSPRGTAILELNYQKRKNNG